MLATVSVFIGLAYISDYKRKIVLILPGIVSAGEHGTSAIGLYQDLNKLNK